MIITMSGTTRVDFNNVNASYIGAMCSNFRRYFTTKSQDDVANEIGCSREAVSKFERGRVCNGVVFMWYIKNGVFTWLPVDKWDGWNGWILETEKKL